MTQKTVTDLIFKLSIWWLLNTKIFKGNLGAGVPYLTLTVLLKSSMK